MKPIVNVSVFVAVLLDLLSCGSPQQQALVQALSIPHEDDAKWTELFTDRYVVVPLQTDSACMVGVIDKIKKQGGDYYIASSGSTLHRFNKEGRWVCTLDRRGQGPEEYIRIEDFDVYKIAGRTEIWISDNKNLKMYDADTGDFIRKISFPYLIYKFRRLPQGDILLVTGQNDHLLTLVDAEGRELSTCLEKEIPFVMFRPVQWVRYGQNYLFQLGISNGYVLFDTESESFSRGVYSGESSYLSENDLISLFDSQGIEFIREANKHTYLSNVITAGRRIWFEIYHAGRLYLSTIVDGGMLSTEMEKGSPLSTFVIGDSESSLLLYLQPDQLQESGVALVDAAGHQIQVQPDDNPILVDFLCD